MLSSRVSAMMLYPRDTGQYFGHCFSAGDYFGANDLAFVVCPGHLGKIICPCDPGKSRLEFSRNELADCRVAQRPKGPETGWPLGRWKTIPSGPIFTPHIVRREKWTKAGEQYRLEGFEEGATGIDGR